MMRQDFMTDNLPRSRILEVGLSTSISKDSAITQNIPIH